MESWNDTVLSVIAEAVKIWLDCSDVTVIIRHHLAAVYSVCCQVSGICQYSLLSS